MKRKLIIMILLSKSQIRVSNDTKFKSYSNTIIILLKILVKVICESHTKYT